jgi:hypothetical protein
VSRVINKGERIVFSYGDYSDYMVLAVVDAAETFDIDFCRKEFMTWQAEKNLDEYGFSEYQFLSWLVVVRGLLVEASVNWKEWHLGDYYESSKNGQDLSLWRDAEHSWDSAWPGKDAREKVEKANG